MIVKILMLAAVVAALFFMVMQPRRGARRCSSRCAWPPRWP